MSRGPSPRSVSRIGAAGAAAVGLGALMGWQFDVWWLKGTGPGHATVNPLTAAALVVLGASLWLGADAPPRSARSRAAVAGGAAVVLLGLARLSAYLLSWDLGLDRVLFASRVTAALPTSRVAPQTTVEMLLLGAALVLMGEGDGRRTRSLWSQLVALAAGLIALVGAVGHAYDTRYIYGAMALHTALASLLAAAGILWARPDRGIPAVLAGLTAGGVLLRRLVPAMIGSTLLLGWLRLAGQRAGLYDTAGGTAFFVGAMVAVLAGLVWWSARAVDRADAERRAVEERYHLLFQRNPLPCWVFDVETLEFLAVNDAAVRAYGYDRAEFLGMKITDIRPPEDVPQVLEAVGRIRPGHEGHGLWRHRRKDGSLIDVEITSHELVFGGRRAEIVLARDVTERKRIEDALRASEERFRLLVGSVRDAIFMLDPDGRVASWNEGAQRIKGYTPEEIIGQHFSRFYPAEAAATGAPDRALRTAVATGRFEEESWRVRKDGTRFWANVVMAPVRDAGGALVGFAKVTRDLTERKRAEEALHASERRLAQLLEAIPVGVFVLDAQGKPYYANEKAVEILGRGIDPQASVQDLPKLYRAYVAGTDAIYSAADLPISHALAGRRAHAVLDIRRPDRTVPIEVWAAPVRDAQGAVTHAVAAFSDITEREQARIEIERLNEELSRRIAELQAANAELDAFAYSVSHDLRAPLRAIDGFSQALLEDYQARLDDAGRGYLRRVRAATQRMGVLIDDLLGLSRVTRAELRRAPVDLSAVAETVAAELKRTAPRRKVEFVIAPDVTAEGDQRLLRVVLENLLGNAWKYTGKQSQARIEFGMVDGDGGRVFYVRDDGAGFDMAYAGKLFGAFQRLHASDEFEGTGIGLATVQRIVHRHGGRVWAEGAVGRGATFYFTL